MRGYDIIIEPILTQKAYMMVETKEYGFKVKMNATKGEIKKAVEDIFGVEVVRVNTVIVAGKVKRRGRTIGSTSDYKKAYVKLSADSKPIEYFESLK